MPNLRCKICGAEFPPIIERHYVSRDLTKTGLAAAFGSTDEPVLYDTYDCPNCGCQVIAQPRKRSFDQKSEETTDEELLADMDSKIIADHLGLDDKTINFLREAKENGISVIAANVMPAKDIFNCSHIKIGDIVDIPVSSSESPHPSSLYFDDLETAGDKLWMIRQHLEKKGFISIGDVSQILGEKHNIISRWGWTDLNRARIVHDGKNRYYISFPAISNHSVPREAR